MNRLSTIRKRILAAILFVHSLAFPTGAQVTPFRFIQLTDTHLSPNNAAPTEDLLRSIRQINATDSIDFVLVTGDLTEEGDRDRKSTRLNSSHANISYAVFCLKKKEGT